MDKLLELQKRLKPLKKDAKGYNYQYFDINSLLAMLKPILIDLELMLAQGIAFEEGANILRTTIRSGDDKTFIESTVALPENSDPQKFGSTLTYYRRYALQALLALEAEDDDGAAASKSHQAKASVDNSQTINWDSMTKLKTEWINDPVKRKEQNDRIKKAGGKWNPDTKSWYVPNNK